MRMKLYENHFLFGWVEGVIFNYISIFNFHFYIWALNLSRFNQPYGNSILLSSRINILSYMHGLPSKKISFILLVWPHRRIQSAHSEVRIEVLNVVSEQITSWIIRWKLCIASRKKIIRLMWISSKQVERKHRYTGTNKISQELLIIKYYLKFLNFAGRFYLSPGQSLEVRGGRVLDNSVTRMLDKYAVISVVLKVMRIFILLNEAYRLNCNFQ